LENDLKWTLKEISESRLVSFLYIIYGIAIDLLLGKNNLWPCLLPSLEDFITLQRHLFQPCLEGHSLCSRERLHFPTLEIMGKYSERIVQSSLSPSALALGLWKLSVVCFSDEVPGAAQPACQQMEVASFFFSFSLLFINHGLQGFVFSFGGFLFVFRGFFVFL